MEKKRLKKYKKIAAEGGEKKISPPKAAKKFLALFLRTPFQKPPNISVFDSLTIRFLTRGGVKGQRPLSDTIPRTAPQGGGG